MSDPTGPRDPAFVLPWDEHRNCAWDEVPPCVYCKDHGVRLYQGSLPAERDPETAAKRAACQHNGGSETYDDGTEVGLGFYWVCALCGLQIWPEE